MRRFQHTSRRAFLRTASGAAIALPLLEYTHGHLWGTARAAEGTPRRFVTVFWHGGTISNIHKKGGQIVRERANATHHGLDWWRPAAPSDVLGPIQQPLLPWQDKILLLEGIDNKAAIAQHQYSTGGHTTANACALSAGQISGSQGSGVKGLAPSIDHVVAERLAMTQPTPVQNMHLRVFPKTSEGTGYGSPYYRLPNEPINGERDPAQAFAAYLGGVSDGEEDPDTKAVRLRRTRLLGHLEARYESFKGRVSHQDLIAIDAHLDHLNALSQQLANPLICTVPDPSDVGPTGGGNLVASAQAQVLIAAIRCGVTNVANLECSDMLSPWVPNGHLRDQLSFALQIGHALGHHAREVGPGGSASDELEAFKTYMLENQQWRMQVVAEVLEGLDDPNFMEDGKTILDNSLVLVTSEFSNAARHISYNVPAMLIGSAGGYFDTGRFITFDEHASEDGAGPNNQDRAYASEWSTHNLFTSILQAMGQQDEHFGNDDAVHEGPLPGLT